VKKFTKKILTVACALAMCIICLTGCSWLKVDNYKYYYETVVVSVDKKNFYKKDLVEAFNNYGYQYYESYGYTLEDSVNQTINTMVDRWLLLDSIITSGKYEISPEEELEIKAQAFDYMQDSIFTFETQVREEWELMAETEESEEEKKSLRVEEEVYEPSTYYEDGMVIRAGHVHDDNETFLDGTIAKDSHFTKDRQVITDPKVSNEAWARYITSLQKAAEGEGRSTTEADVLRFEEDRLIELLTNNLYLEKYEHDFFNNLEVDTSKIVEYYKKQYKAQKDRFLSDESLYHTAMKDAAKNYIYFHPNSGNEYVNVKHILIKFSDAQTQALTALEKEKENGSITEAAYNAKKRNIVNQTTSTFEMDGETKTWNAIVSTDDQTSVYEYVQSKVTGATLKERCAQFNELMYIFNDDEGSMNSEFDYVVNLDTSVADQMVKPFANGVRALDKSSNGEQSEWLNDTKGGEGAGSMDYIVSEYGIHIIFHAGNAVNLVDENNIDNIADEEILRLLCTTMTTPESNKSIFNLIYDTLKLEENAYNVKSQGDINTIRTELASKGIKIKIYEDNIKDLWK